MKASRISTDSIILSLIVGLLVQTMIYQFLGISFTEVSGAITILLFGLLSMVVWPMTKVLL